MGEPESTANSKTAYHRALASFLELSRTELAQLELNPLCCSKLLTHGSYTEQAIVFFHGFTNCPQQFAKLAQEFFERGCNVFTPRMPHHGESDRERNSLYKLTAAELVAFTDRAIDLAVGLGKELTVFGLSGGGTLAAYAGQVRSEIAIAVPVAPFFGPKQVPAWLIPAVIFLGEVLPPISFGVTPTQASKRGTYAPYAYLNNSSRASAAFMRVGLVTQQRAKSRPHAARRTLLFVNDADDTVNAKPIALLQRFWGQFAPKSSGEYHFNAALKLPHDLIGPDRIDSRSSLVYPILTQLLAE